MKKTLFLLTIFCSLNAAEPTNKDKKMTSKIVQVEFLSSSSGSKQAETLVNKFLIEKKLTRQNILDIKLGRTQNFVTVMLVYEIEYCGEQ